MYIYIIYTYIYTYIVIFHPRNFGQGPEFQTMEFGRHCRNRSPSAIMLALLAVAHAAQTTISYMCSFVGGSKTDSIRYKPYSAQHAALPVPWCQPSSRVNMTPGEPAKNKPIVADAPPPEAGT